MIGGGGGIAMAVGYSRTFAYPAFLACTAIAVAPVPALVLLAIGSTVTAGQRFLYARREMDRLDRVERAAPSGRVDEIV